jgi:hypothetical protein
LKEWTVNNCGLENIMSLSTNILKAFIGASLAIAGTGAYCLANPPQTDPAIDQTQTTAARDAVRTNSEAGYIGLGGGLLLAGISLAGLKTQQAVERRFGI